MSVCKWIKGKVDFEELAFYCFKYFILALIIIPWIALMINVLDILLHK